MITTALSLKSGGTVPVGTGSVGVGTSGRSIKHYIQIIHVQFEKKDKFKHKIATFIKFETISSHIAFLTHTQKEPN